MKNISNINKYLALALVCLFVHFIYVKSADNVTVHTVANIDEKTPTVVIDAGHGGSDAGKVAGKIMEKDINLQISILLEQELKKMGYNTVMIRTDDNMPKNKQDEMWLRQKRANESDGDIFVSIHQNSSKSYGAKGFQVYYFKKSEKSKSLATDIYNSIKASVNQSTKFEPLENTNYYVLRTTKMPAVLVECGFLSNEGERWLLTTKEYQVKMAYGIAKGIDDYFQKE